MEEEEQGVKVLMKCKQMYVFYLSVVEVWHVPPTGAGCVGHLR